MHAISAVESMEILSLEYDMDVYMATLFGHEAWDVLEGWVDQKARVISQHKSHKYFCIK